MKILKSLYNNDVLVVGEGKSESDIPFDNKAGVILTSIIDKNGIKADYIAANKEDWDDSIIDIRDSLIQLIDESKASKVMVLGAASARALYPEIAKGQRMSTLTSIKPVEIRGKQVSIVNHPKFVSEMLKTNGEAIDDYEKKILQLYNNVPDEYDISINRLGSFEEFLPILAELDHSYSGIHGFDVETNAEQLYHKNFNMTLFSWSIMVDEKTVISWVVPADILDDRNQVMLFLGFIKRHKDLIITYNCSFEMAVIWTWLGEFVKLQDAMVLVTMDGQRSSLKVAARRYLGVELWSDSVNMQLHHYELLYKCLSLKKCYELKEALTSENLTVTDYLNPDIELEVKRVDKVTNELTTLIQIAGAESVQFGITQFPYPWASVDRETLGEYCAYDSAYTILLWEKLYDRYSDGYPTYIKHPWLATKFESYGILWDDDEACKLADESISKMNSILGWMIDQMVEDQDDKMKALDIMSWKLPVEQIWYTEKTQQKRVNKIETEYDRLDELKKIFNPNSNTQESRNMFWAPYMTDEVANATILYSILESLRIKEIWGVVFSIMNPDQLNEDEFLVSKTPIELIEMIVGIQSDESVRKPIRNMVGDAIATSVAEYKTEYSGRFAKEVMTAQYDIQKTLLGIDIEDETTWSVSFRLLFNIALFKKLGKMVSTYIDGSIGRGRVFRAKMRDDTSIPLLLSSYWSGEGLRDGEIFVLKPSFNSLAAVTHRWSSPIHTISPSSPTRRCLKPLRPDMLMIHADFSQAELVMLAFFSQDENMMQAFIDGKDMHKFVASKAFQKNYDDITGEERRSAKGISFGVVYGVSIENLALTMTGGDVAEAQKLFDIFFENFPALRGWMDARKAEGHKYGYVTNFLGARIMLDEGANDGAIERQSVNYPIQGSSSVIAGASMFDLCDWCDDLDIFHLPWCFTHDSLDDFFVIDTMIEYLDGLKYNMQEKVREDIGAPMSIDMEIGVDGYNLCEIEDMKIKGKSFILTLKGTQESVRLLLDKVYEYSKKFSIGYIIEQGSEEVHTPMEELFTAKGSYNDRQGVTEIHQKLEIELMKN